VPRPAGMRVTFMENMSRRTVAVLWMWTTEGEVVSKIVIRLNSSEVKQWGSFGGAPAIGTAKKRRLSFGPRRSSLRWGKRYEAMDDGGCSWCRR